MNYEKIYSNLISKIRENPYPLCLICENHHIVPVCLGGKDNVFNLIRISPKDHYISHRLLAKIHGGRLWIALNLMRHKKAKTAKNVRIPNHSQKTISAMVSIEFSKLNKGRKHSKETIAKFKAAQNNPERTWYNTGFKHTEETKQKLREIALSLPTCGQLHTEKAKQKMRKPKAKLKCPHCGMVGGSSQMTRWHFDSCKNR